MGHQRARCAESDRPDGCPAARDIPAISTRFRPLALAGYSVVSAAERSFSKQSADGPGGMAETIPILRVIDAGAVVSIGGSAIEDLSAFARRASAS
jgi:hypothetical protein